MIFKIKQPTNYIGLSALMFFFASSTPAQALSLRGSFDWAESVLSQFGTTTFNVNRKERDIGSLHFLIDSLPDPTLEFKTEALFTFNRDNTISGFQFTDVDIQTQEGGIISLNNVVITIDNNLSNGQGTLLISDTNVPPNIENVPDQIFITNFQSQVVPESSNILGLGIILGLGAANLIFRALVRS